MHPPSSRNALVRAADVGAPFSVPLRSTPTYSSCDSMPAVSICRFALPWTASAMSPWLLLSGQSFVFAPAASPLLIWSRKSCTNCSPSPDPPPLPPPPPVLGSSLPDGSLGPVGRDPPPLASMPCQHQSLPSLASVAS
jgi:hypothetical protein